MSVQVILWWMFQLAAIMTITCIHVLLKKYEEGHFMLRLSPELKEHIDICATAKGYELLAQRSL